MTGRIITSTVNPLVKELVTLSTRRSRDATGTFLIEGRREVDRAVAAGLVPDIVLVCDDLVAQGSDPIATIPATADIYRLSEPAFRKISRRQNPDGIAVRMATPSLALGNHPLADPATLLVAEAIEKPGNLGAMLRTAEALGVDLVIVADPVTDIFNPNVIRASQGAVFSVPIATADPVTTRSWLSERGIASIAGYPEGGRAPWDVDLMAGVAVVVGAEADGITAGWSNMVTAITIPMNDAADSLNTATTAAILLYEVMRQRAASLKSPDG